MPTVPKELRRIFSWLVEHAKLTEWQTRHAAENRYCPYCESEEDEWRDQKEHHDGCHFVKYLKEAEDAVAR